MINKRTMTMVLIIALICSIFPLSVTAGDVYIDGSHTYLDDPYDPDQYDFGETIIVTVDVDKSSPSALDVDVFVYLFAPNDAGVSQDSVYRWRVEGTTDDLHTFYLDVGWDYMDYVGQQWRVRIIVRDSDTFTVLAEKRFWPWIGPRLIDHFTCRDYNNPHTTRTSTFYDTDIMACHYTEWDTHGLYITYSIQFKWYEPSGSAYFTWDDDLTPGSTLVWRYSYIWIKDHYPAEHTDSWHVDLYLDTYFKARDDFTIQATVLPLDVNLVSPPSPPNGGVVTTSPVELMAQVTSAGSPVQDAIVRFYVDGIGEVGSDYSDSSGYGSINYYPMAGSNVWYARAEKTGYDPGESDHWSFTYNPPPEPDFSVHANPSSLSIERGSSGTTTVYVDSLNGFDADILLSVSNLPSGVSYSYSVNPVRPPINGQTSSALTLTISSSATEGTYYPKVVGTSSGFDPREYQMELEIRAKLQYDLTIIASPPGGGTTNPLPGTYTYDSGSFVTVSQTSNPSYVFANWDLDGMDVGSGTSYTVAMDEPHTLIAIFKSSGSVIVTQNVPRTTLKGLKDLGSIDLASSTVSTTSSYEVVGETISLDPQYITLPVLTIFGKQIKLGTIAYDFEAKYRFLETPEPVVVISGRNFLGWTGDPGDLVLSLTLTILTQIDKLPSWDDEEQINFDLTKTIEFALVDMSEIALKLQNDVQAILQGSGIIQTLLQEQILFNQLVTQYMLINGLLAGLTAAICVIIVMAAVIVIPMSPVSILVTDPTGRRVGISPSGNFVDEIPGSIYTENGIIITNATSGTYSVTANGTKPGEYQLHLVFSNGTYSYQASFASKTAPGVVDNYAEAVEVSSTPSAIAMEINYAYTEKKQYYMSETVIVGVNNTKEETITLTDPWVILDDQGQIVFNARTEDFPIDVSSGNRYEWKWNQKNNHHQQVNPGDYFFQIYTSVGNYTSEFRVYGYSIRVPQDYPTIQAAINNAEPGNTILVSSGTYYEHLVVDKPLTLIGENPDTTIIDGSGTGNVVKITASFVTIKGFTTRNGGQNDWNSGVFLSFSHYCTVTDIVALNSRWGVCLHESCNNYVGNNKISNNFHGMTVLFSSCYNSIMGNNIFLNEAVGIYMQTSCNHSYISYNLIMSNNDGIVLHDCHDNQLTNNQLLNSTSLGIWLIGGSRNNWVYRNDFINNTVHAYDNNGNNNYWDGGYQYGNYWDDYSGVDEYSGIYQNDPGNDGIGDTPCTLDENAQDRYPFMNPISTMHDVAVVSCTTSATVAHIGQLVNVTVVVRNEGQSTETFDVTVFAFNHFSIGTQKVTNLLLSTQTTLTFVWNTTDTTAGNYTISAGVGTLLGETHITDNILIDGTVQLLGHNIATINVAPSKTVVGQGLSLSIVVTIWNRGSYTEIFNVTAYANTRVIETIEITLTSGNSTTITFTWNTAGFAKGNYTIWAYAWPVPGETDTADNTLPDGWVIVAMVGDITGPDGWPDGKVDMIYDIRSVAKLFGAVYPDPSYNPNCDINDDGKIDMIIDIRTVAKHFGDTDP